VSYHNIDVIDFDVMCAYVVIPTDRVRHAPISSSFV